MGCRSKAEGRTVQSQTTRVRLVQYKGVTVQNFRTSELQNFRTLELQNLRTSEPQKESELQNSRRIRTSELQKFRLQTSSSLPVAHQSSHGGGGGSGVTAADPFGCRVALPVPFVFPGTVQ